MIVNEVSLGFPKLVGQKKQFLTFFVPGDPPLRRRVGDAGNSGLDHQLRPVVELHPHLSTRQLQTHEQIQFFHHKNNYCADSRILGKFIHELPGMPIQHWAQISTSPLFLCFVPDPAGLGSFSYSGWLW